MMLKTFTDNYGIAHVDAVVIVEGCNSSSNENYDESGAVIGANSNVSYNYRYWTSQVAKDNGAEPLSGNESIDTITSVQGDKTLFEWCEADLDLKLT